MAGLAHLAEGQPSGPLPCKQRTRTYAKFPVYSPKTGDMCGNSRAFLFAPLPSFSLHRWAGIALTLHSLVRCPPTCGVKIALGECDRGNGLQSLPRLIRPAQLMRRWAERLMTTRKPLEREGWPFPKWIWNQWCIMNKQTVAV